MTNQNPWLCSAETWASLFLRQKLKTTQNRKSWRKISWNHNAQKNRRAKTVFLLFVWCPFNQECRYSSAFASEVAGGASITNMVFTRTWIDEFYSEVKSQEKNGRNHWKSKARNSFRFYRWEWSLFFLTQRRQKGKKSVGRWLDCLFLLMFSVIFLQIWRAIRSTLTGLVNTIGIWKRSCQ